ncbi:SAM-dependent methyltransferase [Aureliella helgolandensis]|uniref:Cobalt-precorrin-4 C(11)-methyltransferase n=1 Tax=Aureliella helgolandensis TaxID=2527968 RepID=A0A518GBB8_9BACT|nr:SAM-dependent methyltransferase [Aureliella helgolandensis]QDV25830.1 Cobalt-precorrin-4 C(11)-methyltransferase [Aureliella helgolandensis]
MKRLSSSMRYFMCVFSAIAVSTWMQSTTRAQESSISPFTLVGLGPGDPELLTLRAIKVIESADVVFCRDRNVPMLGDQLKGKELHFDYWRLFPFYGQSEDSIKPEQLNEFRETQTKRIEFVNLVRAAVAAGKKVAVLDMGDPMVFGPSAWTLEEFADLNPKVVPGVSAFNAANAALRRSVTNGKHTKSVTLTAGDRIGAHDNIEQLSVHQNSMVLFTMRTEFREFIEKLSVNYPADTPLAVVQHAGDSNLEKVIESTVGTALNDIRADELPFDYMIYVGSFLDQKY